MNKQGEDGVSKIMENVDQKLCRCEAVSPSKTYTTIYLKKQHWQRYRMLFWGVRSNCLVLQVRESQVWRERHLPAGKTVGSQQSQN